MQELASVLDLRSRRTWRGTKNTIMTVVLGGAVVVVAVPLVLVMVSVFAKGGSILFAHFPKFLTADIPPTRAAGPGMGPAIVGTLMITGMATLIAVPLGVMGAIYLHEYGGQSPFARLVRFMAMVMTGVPSIVMGLFIYVVWTLNFKLQGFGGALALACLMLPIVINASEQMLKLVPNGLREASYALGATKARTVLTIVLPAASSGIVSGSLLAVARAAGETAPLLFTALNNRFWSLKLDQPMASLPAFIYDYAKAPYEDWNRQAWTAALTLLFVVAILSGILRLSLRRSHGGR